MKRHAALIPLSREHNTALVLCLRIEREIPAAGSARVTSIYRTVLSFWARGLLPHFRVENECLLARLIRHVGVGDELIGRTHRDHLAIEALVVDMRDNPDIESRRRLLLRFGERLRTHIRWEEDALFRATQEKMTEAELAALGADVTDQVGDGNTPLD